MKFEDFNEEEFEAIYERNADTVYRICFSYMKNKSDAEDAVQDTFVNLIKKNMKFENYNHEKAWLIVTAGNICKNKLKSWKRKVENIEDYNCISSKENEDIDETLKFVLNLPAKYKMAIYLYYYEGYTTIEISKITGVKESSVRSQLKRGREMLELKIGGELMYE